MKTNNKSRSKDPKHNKREKSTSGAMKIFHILMLLLLASSSLIRIAGAKGHAAQAVETPTSVRLFDLPVEGRLAHGFAGLDVGQRIQVQLEYVDVERGYIDFKKNNR